jgi:hypothetical protein
VEVGLIEKHDGRVERELGAAGLHGDGHHLVALEVEGDEARLIGPLEAPHASQHFD